MIRKTRRPGAALILLVVCMAVLSILMTAVVSNSLAQKRFLQRREHQVQAYWLAQAGIERAAARILADPRDYRGETLELIPDSKVVIAVTNSKDVIRITSDATFPKDATGPASFSASRTFKLKQENGKRALGMAISY